MKLTLTLEIEMTPDEMLKALSPEGKERIAEKENKMFLKFAEESANQDEKVGRQLAETLSEMRATWIAREGEFEAIQRMYKKKMTCGLLEYDLSNFTGGRVIFDDARFEITDVRLRDAISH